MEKIIKYGVIGVISIVAVLLIRGTCFIDKVSAEPASNTYTPEDNSEAIIEVKKDDSIRVVQEKEARTEDSLRGLQKQEALVQLEKFRKKHDEFINVTFYQDKGTPL